MAVSRVFGAQAAELPLVATAAHARRRGHARVMLAAFEELLAQVCPLQPASLQSHMAELACVAVLVHLGLLLDSAPVKALQPEYKTSCG